MPYQGPPVLASVVVTGSPVLGNPNILIDWDNIAVYKLDKEDSIQHIFYRSGSNIEAQIILLAKDGLA